MTEFTTRHDLAQIAAIVPETPRPEPRGAIDRSFELPAGLYVATVGFYLGFLAVMAGAFMNPGLVLPMVIFVLFVVAGFGTPMLWVRMTPENRQRALSWAQFRNRGVQIATGPLTSGAAMVQVLILPALIFLWGVSVAVIAALT